MQTKSNYNFKTEWKLCGTAEEVFEIISDVHSLTRWWPSVYLEVRETPQQNDNNFELYTKGFLPYTLTWQLKVVEVIEPHSIVLEAYGDLEGKGKWTITDDGHHVSIKYDWQVNTNKFILKYFSFLLKPIFSANHFWAMDRGLEGLEIEMMKRRWLPSQNPKGPTFPHNFLKRNIKAA
jgi:hypothetical protein